MRILYFSDNTSGHNRRFLRKLAISGHEIWFCDFASQNLPPKWLPAGVRTYTLKKTLPRSAGPQEVIALLPEIRTMLAELKPDVVHAGPVQTCGYLIAKAEYHPMLLASWGSDILLFSKRDEHWRAATCMAIEGADGLMADCQWVLETARTFGDIPDERVVMLPWGIEAGHFGPEGPQLTEQEFRREPGTFVFLCTRSWEPLYGMDTLLEAFRIAHQQRGELRLILIGGGSQEHMLREFIRKNRLEDAVEIPGQLDGHHLPRWFRSVDAYISCSKSDGTSISLLEAMATGLPVIVTDIPSNREWVERSVNGWVAVDAQGFAEAMLNAANLSAEQRSAMSAANRRSVAERADWDRNFPRLLAMYEYLGAHPRKFYRSRPVSM